MTRLINWRLLPFFIFVVLVLFFWRGLSLDPQKLPSSKLDHPLPVFKLPVLGHENEIMTSDRLTGQVSLLNVWASWCAACVEEQVFLLQLAKEGVPLYGLNYKDTSDQALKWLAEWGNPYRLIAEDAKGKVAIDLGVYGAPETFLIDRKGIIRYRHAGILDEANWKKEFLPRIKQLKRQS
ncbi:DsbE family thiol:disulfide interchange protein [Legionella sp. MW5194]|uniref:DsbE family thiol:disulfide interchange protein n=1 Tax=Legionella sp. MW5194 TaxID=2662448 RepID=UPI00193D328F|nr:DsbE family thiol:disulfide interchange protein [Legionella sp. MW5194]QRN03450.1 DsbE family thiol:disulfide interchange protein [Legionella sp. MW5194]